MRRDRCGAIGVGEGWTSGRSTWRTRDASPRGSGARRGRVSRPGRDQRDQNNLAEYDIGRALRLVTLKLVGYTEVIHALAPRLAPDSSILLFGGQALRRPYPGSTTITTVNGGVTGLMRTLIQQLAPIRVNAIHPGVVGDSPDGSSKPEAVREYHRSNTLSGGWSRWTRSSTRRSSCSRTAP